VVDVNAKEATYTDAKIQRQKKWDQSRQGINNLPSKFEQEMQEQRQTSMETIYQLQEVMNML
jgi:hypothetical protein